MMSKHKLSFLVLSSMIISNMVGTGVLLLPSQLAPFGGLSLIAWAIVIIGIIPVAIIVGNLSQHFPKTGGPYIFIGEVFGQLIGTIFAWLYWFMTLVTASGVLIVVVANLQSFLPLIFGSIPENFTMYTKFIIFAVLLIIGLVNTQSIASAGRFEFMLAAIKVIAFIVIPLCAIRSIDMGNFSYADNGMSTYSNISNMVIMMIWCFIGIDSGTIPAGEVANPQKTIPIAILVAVIISGFIYVLGTCSILGVIGVEGTKSAEIPYVDLARYIFGEGITPVMSLITTLCAISGFNGWVLVIARVPYGAAQMKYFPKPFLYTNHNGAPISGLVISMLIIGIVVLTSLSSVALIKQFTIVQYVAVKLALFVYLICTICYMVLLKKEGGGAMKWGLSILAILFLLWILFFECVVIS